MKRLVIIILVVAGAILAAVAFLAAVAHGFSVPHWVLPTAVFAEAIALLLSIIA